eukprot:526167-Karenia_brevis.AAC.1
MGGSWAASIGCSGGEPWEVGSFNAGFGMLCARSGKASGSDLLGFRGSRRVLEVPVAMLGAKLAQVGAK